MTEFGKDWVGWRFKTDHDGIADVMTDPDGGLALVEVDARPKELVAKLGTAAANLAFVRDNNLVFYGSDPAMVGETLSEMMSELADDMKEFKTALPDVLRPASEPLGEEYPEMSGLILVLGLRHRHKGHIDPRFATAWCGATEPGFFVVRGGKKIQVSSLPEKHVLLMRGENEFGLPGVRHGALYRSSKVRRAVLLGY